MKNKQNKTVMHRMLITTMAGVFMVGMTDTLAAQKLQGLLSSAFDEEEGAGRSELLASLDDQPLLAAEMDLLDKSPDKGSAEQTKATEVLPQKTTGQPVQAPVITTPTVQPTQPAPVQATTTVTPTTPTAQPAQTPVEQQTQQDYRALQEKIAPTAPIAQAPKEATAIKTKKNALAAPKSPLYDKAPAIEFHFENADLSNLVTQIAEIFQVTFITDEAITPLSPTGKAIKGNKISFKTQEPLTTKQAWNLFLNFLDLASLSVVPTADPKIYKIVGTDVAFRSAIPAYIGVDPTLLPENDDIIRYVYFLENSALDAIKSILEALRNQTAPVPPIYLQDSKAFILTDRAYNIKMLMQIVKELDKASMPQTLSVLKLKRVDASTAKTLYEQLSRTEDQSIAARLFPARKQPSSLYFPENTRVFAEPRTNALILLGPKDAILKIEEFITKYVDVEVNKPYSPLYVYQLKYADATTVAGILTEVLQFGKNKEAGKHGGVRGEDKYFKSMSFTPEKEANRLVIRGEYEDYLKALEIIQKLDEPQPQVAIEVLILSVNIQEARELGTQLRSKEPGINGLVGDNVKFQTSGLRAGGAPKGIVENPNGDGVTRLLGNLINLVSGAQPGNTIISMGADAFGVWGIFQALSTLTSLQVVSNPFLTTSNNFPASVVVGETRRVVTSTVLGGNTSGDSMGDYPANLEVKITPKINSDGMITMDVSVNISEFLDATDPSSARTKNRTVTTKTIVADREVLALGGLIQNRVEDGASKVPILGDIPIFGWLFKNKRKAEAKDSLLILISSKIIKPEENEAILPFTQDRIQEYRSTLNTMQDPATKNDPVTKLFFKNKEQSTEKIMDEFIFKRHENKDEPIIQEKISPEQDRKRKIRKRQRLAKNKKQGSVTGIIA